MDTAEVIVGVDSDVFEGEVVKCVAEIFFEESEEAGDCGCSGRDAVSEMDLDMADVF